MLKQTAFLSLVLLLCSKLNAQSREPYYYIDDKVDTVRGSTDYGYRFYFERLYNTRGCWCPIFDSTRAKPDENSPFKWTKENGGFFIADSLGNYLRDVTDEDWDFLKEDTIPNPL